MERAPSLSVVTLLQRCSGYKPLAYEYSPYGIQCLGRKYNITKFPKFLLQQRSLRVFFDATLLATCHTIPCQVRDILTACNVALHLLFL